MHMGHFELRLLGIVLVASLSLASGAHAACLSKPAAASASGKQHVIAPKGEVAAIKRWATRSSNATCRWINCRDRWTRSVRWPASAPNAVQTRVSSSKGLSLRELCASGRAGLAEMRASTKPP